MRSARLFPRLGRTFASRLWEEQRDRPLDELRCASAATHPFAVWPATGAPRITAEELERLAETCRRVAADHGYPGQSLDRDRRAPFDRALGRALWADAPLTPAEAAVPEVWSFLALVLVPDVVHWRAADSTNVERFVASDLTRHTLARLWWRAHLFTHGLEDPSAGLALWETIGEADLDQIMTRRGGFGVSPKPFRALVRVYGRLDRMSSLAAVESRREFWRSYYLRWLLRLGAFVDFHGLTEGELEEEFTRFLEELASGLSDERIGVSV